MSGRGRSPRRHLSTVAAEGAISPSGGTPPGLPRGAPHRNPLLTGCPLRSRSLSDPDDPASSPPLAPTEPSLQELATVAATRWVAEPCLKEAKGRAGWTRARSGAGRAGTGTSPHRCRPVPGRLDGARGAPAAGGGAAAARARRGLVWWGRGGDGRSASAPDAATTVVACSTAGTIAHGSQLRQ